jgi:hypothetical protein
MPRANPRRVASHSLQPTSRAIATASPTMLVVCLIPKGSDGSPMLSSESKACPMWGYADGMKK